MSMRNTPQRSTYCRPDPAASRIVCTFLRHCSVCCSMSAPASRPVFGSVAPWPDTKISRSNAMPGEYGPTGRGRRSLRTGECAGASIVSLTFSDRSIGIARPLAPRTGIEPRARDPGMLEREQVVARGHARSAVADDAVRRHVADGGTQMRAEIFGRPERSVVADIGLIEMIRGAGNVAGHAIDRLALAAIAFGGARVDQPVRRIAAQRCDGVDVDDHLGPQRRREGLRRCRLHAAARLAS